jgi:V8-like Glu-specific endopeptidase
MGRDAEHAPAAHPITSVEIDAFISRPRTVASSHGRGAKRDEGLARADRDVLWKTGARLRSRTLAKHGLMPASEAARGELSYELVIAGSNLAPAWFLSRGAECARAIAKLEVRGVAHNGARGTWHGTGFLVSPNILLTNWHVLHSVEVARQASATFGYEHSAAGLLDAGVGFEVNPARLFVSNRDLDFTFVWVDAEPGRQFGHICLARNAFSVVEGECVNIVQHPNGRPKEVAIQDNLVKRVDPEVVLYTTDTEPGSSGSCVFNNRWLPVALHHASKTSDTGEVTNEGIRLTSRARPLTSSSWFQSVVKCSAVRNPPVRTRHAC